MKQSRNVFMRREIKYLLNIAQKENIQKEIIKFTYPDEYGKSRICNLYYDTPNMLLIRNSIEKPFYKEKLRLRSYGTAQDEDRVFVELKKKYSGLVFKRRISMSQHEAIAYIGGASPKRPDSQIACEIDYFLDFYRELEPSMFISYDRTALFANDDPNLRITFDENVKWRNNELSLKTTLPGNLLLDDSLCIMEIKTASSIPLWLTRLLDVQGVFNTSISKYGRAYALQQNMKEREAVIYA